MGHPFDGCQVYCACPPTGSAQPSSIKVNSYGIKSISPTASQEGRSPSSTLSPLNRWGNDATGRLNNLLSLTQPATGVEHQTIIALVPAHEQRMLWIKPLEVLGSHALWMICTTEVEKEINTEVTAPVAFLFLCLLRRP